MAEKHLTKELIDFFKSDPVDKAGLYHFPFVFPRPEHEVKESLHEKDIFILTCNDSMIKVKLAKSDTGCSYEILESFFTSAIHQGNLNGHIIFNIAPRYIE